MAGLGFKIRTLPFYKFTKDSSEKIKIYKNFQRRFRPKLIRGIVDKECYAILKTLI